jgi:molybdopterin-guanine dinucleotide biosynthesis protein A
MASDTIAAVLAGGRSSRMGTAKALVELAGRPLISYPLAAAAEAGLEAVVVAKPDSELPKLDCEVLREPAHPTHPLVGVVAALRRFEGRALVAIACDLPFVPTELVRAIADAEDRLVVCEGAGRLQPLLGRYAPTLAAELEAAIERGDSAQATARALGARIIGEGELSNFGPPGRVLFNVNDPSELAEAERLARTGPN